MNNKKLTSTGEELLEPLLRSIRFGAGRKYLTGHSKILDFGCGPKARLYHYLKTSGIYFDHYVGVDPLITKEVKHDDFHLTGNLKNIKGKFDLITMFAVLEHLPYPECDLSFLKNNTKRGSVLVLTTPSPIGKLVLENLLCPLGLVSKREIKEHQHYFTHKEIEKKFAKIGFKTTKMGNLCFGLNFLSVLIKI